MSSTNDNAKKETRTLSTSILRLRQTVDPWLREVMFPDRDKKYLTELDSVLRHKVIHENPSRDRADAELELEARAWLRDFWSRSIVAWIALVISIISVVFAVCAFFR